MHRILLLLLLLLVLQYIYKCVTAHVIRIRVYLLFLFLLQFLFLLFFIVADRIVVDVDADACPLFVACVRRVVSSACYYYYSCIIIIIMVIVRLLSPFTSTVVYVLGLFHFQWFKNKDSFRLWMNHIIKNIGGNYCSYLLFVVLSSLTSINSIVS